MLLHISENWFFEEVLLPTMDSAPPFVMDRKHVNRMLVHILKVGEVGSMDFSWMTTNWRIVDENLNALREAGLLDVRIPTRGRKSLRYSLTQRGKLVAITELLQHECIMGRYEIEGDIVAEDILRLWEPDGKLRRICSEDE